ncbi:MAG TPA: hypothetical protein VLV78_22385 [Thermoanaerobaculia bacterium]|nr:hypothetical protein [Thermoanaerobaculia bacterium]
MSWDIFIQQFPDGARTVSEIPDTFTAGPIGRRSDLIAKIRSVLPDADFTDPAWGVLDGHDYTIEFGLGDEDPLYGITLHVRGSDAVLPSVTKVIDALGLRAIDSWTGEFFDPGVAAHSLARWRNYIEEGS